LVLLKPERGEEAKEKSRVDRVRQRRNKRGEGEGERTCLLSSHTGRKAETPAPFLHNLWTSYIKCGAQYPVKMRGPLFKSY
jgi:hypothetical protein